MRGRRCRRLAELRSAYLDSVLGDAEREQVQTHLLSCPSCRLELEDLRRVRKLLAGMSSASVPQIAPTELSARLVSIAGSDADSPVWCRPFRRTHAGVLPSRRRAVRVRATAAALALGGLVGASGVVGYLAAPAAPAAVRDPMERARSGFGGMLAELPLTNRAADALLVTARLDQLRADSRRSGNGSKPSGRRQVTAAVATATLRRAADSADRVRFAGTQQVTFGRGEQLLSAAVQVVVEPGQGSDIRVLDRRGQSAVERYLPPATSTSVKHQLLSLLLQNYELSGWQGERVLGRPVTTVQAAALHDDHAIAARWWVDDVSGLVLRQETYDEAGLVLGAGFTEVSISPAPTFLPHLAPRLAISSLPASLAASGVDQRKVSGWSCPDELAGLSLVQVRSDQVGEPQVVHLLYSDGLHTVSVFEQHGSLAGPPTGSHWDDSVQAYRRDDVAASATWRSANTVFTVVSDAPALLEQVVSSLPREPSLTPTTMDRVQAGWSRIRDRVTG
ncbi:MAG TPA: zf-HC2 domain-containing protein [Propionibacteriaceae bacterium]|nr:zf-HC2 domain-containing protein [Propionibacteriaceae bacterium]